MATLIGYVVFILVVLIGMTVEFAPFSGDIKLVRFFIDLKSILLVVPGAFCFALVAGKAHRQSVCPDPKRPGANRLLALKLARTNEPTNILFVAGIRSADKER